MAERGYRDGNLITLPFELANVPASATTNMTLSQGSTGFVVPTGYSFYPQILSINSNADATAGTCTGKVTGDGTVLVNGPEPVVNDTVQRAAAEVNPLASQKVAAGAVVGIALVTASFAPTTADVDAILIGRLIAEPS